MRRRCVSIAGVVLMGCVHAVPDTVVDKDTDTHTDSDSDSDSDSDTDTDTDTDEVLSPLIVRKVQEPCANPAARNERAFDRVGVGPAREGTGNGYVGSGAGVGDLDGDGRPELLLPGKGPLTVWASSGTAWEERVGVVPTLVTDDALGVWPVDIDGDGDLDLHVLRFGLSDALLENDGTGRLTHRSGTGVEGLTERSTTVAWGDIDRDGDLDAVVGAYGDDPAGGTLPGTPDATRVLLQGPAWTFTDVAESTGTEFRRGWVYHVAIQDFDDDGRLDVLSLRDFGFYFQRNRLLWGRAEGLVPGDLTNGLEIPSSAMGAGVGDWDGDGRVDVAISGFLETQLLAFRSTKWFDIAASVNFHADAATRRTVSWGVELQDFDHDGRTDLMSTFGPWYEQSGLHNEPDEEGVPTNTVLQPDLLGLQSATGVLEDASERMGFGVDAPSRGLVVDDLDDDGWLDAVVREAEGPAWVHRARCGEASSIVVRPAPAVAPALAVGARVQVTQGETTLTRWLHAGGTGCCSGASLWAHAAVAEGAGPVTVQVRWTDGVVSEVTANSLIGSVIWIDRPAP